MSGEAETTEQQNKTLAEQVSSNEYEMYQRTQQHMQEIEEEASLFCFVC